MRILLGICGSVSAYKSIELLRQYVKAGHEVKIILTRGATQFVRAELFHYLGAKAVYHFEDDFKYPNNDQKDPTKDSKSNVLHIELASWAEKLVIAPASANTIAKFAMGITDDLLTSVFLAYSQDKMILLFPAMNTRMFEHPILKRNLKLIEDFRSLKNLYIDHTDFGDLACGDHGAGRLAETRRIFHLSLYYSHLKEGSKKVLITTGSTVSPLDPVRFVTNPSSGKTGLALAFEALKRGHHITLIYGHQSTKDIQDLKGLKQVELIEVKTTQEMFDQVVGHFSHCDNYLSPAAISDIEFDYTESKIKKDVFKEGSLKIKKAPDILKEVLPIKKANQKVIGFAAETDLSEKTLNEKLKTKPVDILVGTKVNNGILGSTKEGFEVETGQYLIYSKENGSFQNQTMNKTDLSQYLFEALSK